MYNKLQDDKLELIQSEIKQVVQEMKEVCNKHTSLVEQFQGRLKELNN